MVAACCLVCHVAVIVDMNRWSSPAAGPPSPAIFHLGSLKPPQTQLSACPRLVGLGFRFELRRKERSRRRLRFVVSADLSKSFSLSFGLDSQVADCFF